MTRLPRALAGLLALALALFAARAADASVARYRVDAVEVESMRAQNPRATDALEQGERLAAAGHLEEALALFRQAEAGLPDHALPRRRECEALTAMGRGAEGVGKCYFAVEILRTNLTMRAIARALVDGPAAPALPQVAQALSLITTEHQRVPNRLALSSALCDIAERIGDGVMLQRCAQELVHIAPDALETRRALARLERQCPPWRFWTGWVAIGLALLLTVWTVARRALAGTRRRVPPAGAIATVLAAAFALTASVGRADDAAPLAAPAASAEAKPADGTVVRKVHWLTSWPIDDKDPESTIPSEDRRVKDPLEFGYWLQDVALKAELASKDGDHAAAVRFYRALAKAVPDRSIAFTKMCSEYEALGDMEKATASCGEGLLVPGVTVGDYAHYVRLLLAKPGKLTSKDEETLAGIVEHLKADPSAKNALPLIECEIGARTSNVAQLEDCAAALVAKAPNDRATIRYQWALAVTKGDFSEAGRLVDAAQKAGAPEKDLEEMRQTLANASKRRYVTTLLGVIAVGLLAAAVTLLVRYLSSRRRLDAQPA